MDFKYLLWISSNEHPMNLSSIITIHYTYSIWAKDHVIPLIEEKHKFVKKTMILWKNDCCCYKKLLSWLQLLLLLFEMSKACSRFINNELGEKPMNIWKIGNHVHYLKVRKEMFLLWKWREWVRYSEVGERVFALGRMQRSQMRWGAQPNLEKVHNSFFYWGAIYLRLRNEKP